VRVGDLLHPSRLRTRLAAALNEANSRLERGGVEPLAPEPLLERLVQAARRLAPHITDTSQAIHEAMAARRSILFEGAQGALLDIDHGTYPFVTSSTTIAGGATSGAGLGPRQVGAVVGVAKAYVTRVGEGPFPTEIDGELADRLRVAGQEYGATTGRPRRCGWLDLPALRYAARLSGLTSLALTKLDILAGVHPLRVAETYRVGGRQLGTFPADAEDLAMVEPVYRDLPGFDGDLSRARTFDELPPGARDYVALVEAAVGVPAWVVSTGAGREQTLLRRDPWG
jgi:adenylosuccinate synthase